MMERGPAPDVIAGGEALKEWRQEATNTFLAAVSIGVLPVLVLYFSGQGLWFTPPMLTVVLAAYSVIVAGALLRRVGHEVRVSIALLAVYLLALLGAAALPNGPYIRSLPIYLAFMALVFIGVRAGRIATVVSAVILLFSPALREVPVVGRFFVHDPTPVPLGLSLLQGLAMTVNLIPLMILMERFHLFLIQSLAAKHQAVVGMEREAAELAVAYGELEIALRERRSLQQELARISNEERRSLGQDMHDGVCQQLTGAVLRCEALKRRLERGGSLDPDDVGALSCLLEEAIDDAYAVARGLDPVESMPGALVQALKYLVKRTQSVAASQCEFVTTGDVHLDDPTVAHHLYRIAQEALSNAVRHARAKRILVELRGDETGMVLRIQDDGTGMPVEPPTGGMGFRTMASRAQAMEGVLSVERPSEGGTRITCRVPRVHTIRTDGRPHDTEEEISGGS